MDNERFLEAKKQVLGQPGIAGGIGTLSEKTLHKILKQYFEPNPAFQEVRVGSFVADICRGNDIIEVQTRNLYPLKGKLEYFLNEGYRVTVVCPMFHEKWLLWIDGETGEVQSRRKSPKKGHFFQIFYDLYNIKSVLAHPNLTFCVVLYDGEEYRYLNGWSRDKKRGSSRCDIMPLALHEVVELEFASCLPDLPAAFTSADVKAALPISTICAQRSLSLLCSMGFVKKIGKKGRYILYEKV